MTYIIATTVRGRKFLYKYLGDDHIEYVCSCGEKSEAYLPFLFDKEGFYICMKCEMPFRYFVEVEKISVV